MKRALQAASINESLIKKDVLKSLFKAFLALTFCFSMVPAQAWASTPISAGDPDNVSTTSSVQSDESVSTFKQSPSSRSVSSKKYSLMALTVCAASATQVNLSWISAGNGLTYKVLRSTYPRSSYDLIASTKSLSYIDTSVKPGTLYAYVIEVDMPNSGTARSSYEEVATPPKSTSASVSATFPKGVTVKWGAAAGATHYYVLRATKGSKSFKVVQSTKSTSFLDTSAVGKKYVYKVRPIFVLGNYEYSHAADTAQVSSDSGKWKKKGTSKSFVFSNGKTAKNWQLINGKWYCFSTSGKMLKNSFKSSGGKKYFLGSSGTIKTGWITYKGKKYYGLKNGGLAKGWQTISGKRYYFSKSGVLAKNKYVDGYHLGKNGAWDGKVKYGSSVGTLSTTKSLLTKVNQARKKVGASSLKWDSGLANAAKLRAKEIKKLFSHTRPNGTSCFTAFPSYLNGAGENIAMGQRSVSEVNTAWTNSPGHYSNMVNTMFNCFGAACFTINGTKYWVELFGRK